MAQEAQRVAIGSIGTVGLALAQRIDAGEVPGLELVAVSAGDLDRARERVRGFRRVPMVVPPGDLASHADVVVECAPAEFFADIARPAIAKGRILVPISVAALLEHMDLVEEAARTGARIRVPSGAILGLDAVRGAAEGQIHSVRMITRKPPRGLAGAPHLVANGIEVEGLTEPLQVFSGTAREGAVAFPANVNVAAALGLAGIGPEGTRLEVWADPGVQHNTHEVVVEADSVRIEMRIQNVPTEENPRTGRLVALSVLATLRRLVSPLVVGT